MTGRQRINAKSLYVLSFATMLAAALFIQPFFLQDAFANWFPVGRADIEITLFNPSYAPIELTEENFDLLLDDVASIPPLLNHTIMPKVREVFIGSNETLHNQYVESILVVYDADKKEMWVDVNAKPHDLARQTFNVTTNASLIQEMSVIGQVSVLMPLFWNYTQEDVLMHFATVNRLEDMSVERAGILADHARGALLMNRHELLSPEERHERRTTNDTAAPTSLTVIRLEMLSIELARASALYAPEENSWWRKAFDEIKGTGYFLTDRGFD